MRPQRIPDVFWSEIEIQLKMDPAMIMMQPIQREIPALIPRYRQLTIVEKSGVK